MNRSTEAPSFGYLRCLEDPALGATGGYLIVSATGRPLEFHCTAPVAASRAQEILFGPTLRPYLLGEKIGRALVQRATIKPSLLCIDDAAAVTAADAQTMPVALLSSTEQPLAERIRAQAGWRRLEAIDEVAWTTANDVDCVGGWLTQLAESIDVAEPFERIGHAIQEAQRLGQNAADPHEANRRDAA